MLRKRYQNRHVYVPPHTPAEASEAFGDMTGEEAEQQIMDYLRQRLGQPVHLWKASYALATAPNWVLARPKASFYRRQIMRLIREGKVIRYYRRFLRDKIRINEGYANPEYAMGNRNG
jgi:hypothetical protein